MDVQVKKQEDAICPLELAYAIQIIQGKLVQNILYRAPLCMKIELDFFHPNI